MRATTSMGRPTLDAHTADAIVNTVIATSRMRRAPNRSVNQPLAGSPAATATR